MLMIADDETNYGYACSQLELSNGEQVVQDSNTDIASAAAVTLGSPLVGRFCFRNERHCRCHFLHCKYGFVIALPGGWC